MEVNIEGDIEVNLDDVEVLIIQQTGKDGKTLQTHLHRCAGCDGFFSRYLRVPVASPPGTIVETTTLCFSCDAGTTDLGQRKEGKNSKRAPPVV